VTALARLQEADRSLGEAGPLPFHLPLGRLAPVVAGAFTGAERADWVVCGPRARVGAILRGCAVERLVDPAAGARPYRLAPSDPTPGAQATTAVGLAVTTGERVLCILLDASVASGSFHEALNLATHLSANVTFLVALHPTGGNAPFARQLTPDPTRIASAFSVPAWTSEPTVDAVAAAVARARALPGPVLIETTLPAPSP